MGAGGSIQGMEELLQTSQMIGKALSSIKFPGMYRLSDFHSNKAPKLNNRAFTFFGMESDDDNEDGENKEIPEEEYIHLFHATVGDDEIYIDDPLQCNDAGKWQW